MKRIKIAFFLLLFLCVLTLASGWLVHSTYGSLLTQLDRIEALCWAGDFPAAQTAIQELLQFYRRQEHLLALFIRRDSLGSTAVSISGLSAYAVPGNLQDLQSEIEKAKMQICTLQHLFFSFV